MKISPSNVRAAVFPLLLAVLLSSSVLQGQTTPAQTPRLRGTIKDPSGAVMPSVDVAVIQSGKVVKAVKTDDLGAFSFDLATGQYTIAVAAPDFKAYGQTIRVSPNMPALAITLSLEGITTAVDVVGNSNEIIVDAAQSLDANILTGDQILDLPDDEEDLLAYLQSLAGGEGNAQIIIDGLEGGRLPRRDQIAQIVIEPNSFNATGTGPRITIVTREPGPRGPWTGQARLQFRDSALNARNPHSENKPPTRRTVVSTNYSGPVIKGRLGMTVNLSKEQYENGSNSIRAITPDGPLNKTFFSPSTYDSLGFSHNWFFNQNHQINYNFNYNRGKDLNQGIGNLNLEERASDSSNHGWNFQISDNKTISPKMTNTVNFRINRNNSRTTPRTNAVAINVLDAFSGGGAQNRSESRNSSWNFNDNLRWTPNPKLNLQFGLNVNHQSNYNLSENNYLGTFTFSSLDDYLAGIPLTFTQTSGNPLAEVSHTDANISMNLTYRISPTMSYSAGAQYTVQTHLRDYNNISPTTQFQVQLKKRHTISLGARMSYNNVGFPIFQYEQLLRGDGTTRQFNTVISNPSYPDPFAGGFSGTTTGVGSSLQQRDPNFVAPYTINTQVSLTEALPKNWRVSASFNINRAVHQLRNRNINAPFPGVPLASSLTQAEIDQLRPFYPYVGRINRFESVGNLFNRNINIQVQVPSKKIFGTQFSGQFQTGWTWQDDDAQWQNPYDVRSDWARNDQRYRFQGTFSVRPPKVGNFNFNFNGNTGRAYTITTGRDDNLDQSINDRPVGVERNSLRGPGQYTVNMNWTSPGISLRKKKQNPAAANAPTGAAGAPAAAAALSPQDQLIQSALAAGIPLGTIQQILISQPNLVIGNPNAPAAPTTPPSLLNPLITFNVQVSNLLNNTRVNGYSGVITSPLFGRATGWGQGRSITLSLQTRF
jgi:hypothetical protein